MRVLGALFERNRAWAEETRQRDPGFFARLAQQQAPEYLWIGCSDSRVPANVIVGMAPGELFVHRNIANQVQHTDLNCQAVLQFAVDVLHVRHIIVCGHYGCGGVRAALRDDRLGLAEHWLRPIRDAADRHGGALDAAGDAAARCDRLCELNVAEQVRNVCRGATAESAWARGQALSVHGWIYGIHDGLLRDLGICVTGADETEAAYREAVVRLGG